LIALLELKSKEIGGKKQILGSSIGQKRKEKE
jgi:hypothetical protein